MKMRNKRKLKRAIACCMVIMVMLCSLSIGGILALLALGTDVEICQVQPIPIMAGPETNIIYEYCEPVVVEQPQYPEFVYSKDWDVDESYLLAKIAMAEAEGCNVQTKTLVILTVLNRVHSEQFPDTIEEVIFQNNGKVYQFSPIGNGRWNRVEPNEDCWEAVRMVEESECDYSDGALYFESCENEDNWHSRNLDYLYQSDTIRFYK